MKETTRGGEDMVTANLSSASFCVFVGAGSAWTAAHTSYQLAVWLESAE